MTTQDEIDEGLLQSVKARKEENPIYWPTPEELAAIDELSGPIETVGADRKKNSICPPTRTDKTDESPFCQFCHPTPGQYSRIFFCF